MDFDDEDHGAEKGDLPSVGGGSAFDSQAPLPNSSRIGPAKMDSSAVGPGYRRQQGGGTNGGRYRECLKNHAVGIGGHAVDGCGEFMPAGDEGTLDALKCAACNCHRNFHRKEVEGGGAFGALSLMGIPDAAAAGGGFHHHHQHHQQFSNSPYSYRTPTAGYFHHPHHVRSAPPPLALPSTSGGGGGGSRDDQDDVSPGAMMGMGGMFGGGSATGGSSKKRFRTKFTPEQKDRMLEFADRLGWRMQKHDEAAVLQFCEETGVKRQVLKVWMHNNKHTHGKGSPAGLLHQPGILLVGQQESEQVVADMGERVVPPGA